MRSDKLLRRRKLRDAKEVLKEFYLQTSDLAFIYELDNWLNEELGKIAKGVYYGEKVKSISDTPGD